MNIEYVPVFPMHTLVWWLYYTNIAVHSIQHHHFFSMNAFEDVSNEPERCIHVIIETNL